MTLHARITGQCAICKQPFKSLALISTNMRDQDLDTRSVGMARDVENAIVEQCKKCGYCSSDLANAADEAKSVVGSAEYQRKLADTFSPKYARRWICHSLICREAGDLCGASWSTLRAAWACDDRWFKKGATSHRAQALRLFEDCVASNQTFAEDTDTEQLIICDLSRRIRRFDQGADIAQTLLDNQNQDIKQVACFQLHLNNLGDDRRYVMSEAGRYAELKARWKPRRWWEFWR